MFADKKKFAAMLKDRRLALALTQQQLASRLGISIKDYAEWEQSDNENWPSLEDTYQLADLLKTDPWTFFDSDKPVFTGEKNSDEKKRKIMNRLLSDPEYFLFCYAAAEKHPDVIKAALLYWNAENLHSEGK